MAAASVVNAAARVFLWAIGWLTYNRPMRRAALAGFLCAGCGHGFFDPLPDCTAAVDAGPDARTTSVTFEQVNSMATTSNAGSLTVPFSTAQKAGDLVVVFVVASQTVTAVTDMSGNIYGMALGPQSGFQQSVYFAENIAPSTPGTNSVTVGLATSAPMSVRIIEFSGLAKSNAVDNTAVMFNGASSVADSGVLTTTHAHDLLVAGDETDGATIAPGDTYTNHLIDSDGRIVEDRVVFAPGTYNATAILNGQASWVMELVAFKADD